MNKLRLFTSEQIYIDITVLFNTICVIHQHGLPKILAECHFLIIIREHLQVTHNSVGKSF